MGKNVRMRFRIFLLSFQWKEKAVAALKTVQVLNISWLCSAF